MLFLIWTIVGAIIGVIWSECVRRFETVRNRDVLAGILIADSGAVLSGLLFTLFGTTSWNAINIYSLVVSFVGALIFLLSYHSMKHLN